MDGFHYTGIIVLFVLHMGGRGVGSGTRLLGVLLILAGLPFYVSYDGIKNREMNYTCHSEIGQINPCH